MNNYSALNFDFLSTYSRKIPHTGDIESLDDADSNTDAKVGWTKNTQKPKKNGKNNPKQKNFKTSREMPKLAIYPLTKGL